MEEKKQECKRVHNSDIWQIFRKIRAATYRVGFSLWDMYKPMDKENTGHISPYKFLSVLSGPMKGIIGLEDDEIKELAAYFQIPDGRIQYAQFCEMIHDNEAKSHKEDDDALSTNFVTQEEERAIHLILTKIALEVTSRRLVLKPFFQDYALVKKSGGAITRGNFALVLDYLGFKLTSEDFLLLVKKYMKDSFTIKYLAFINDINKIIKYFEDHGMVDLSGHAIKSCPGQERGPSLPQLPIAESAPVLRGEQYGIKKVFDPSWKGKTPPKELLEIIIKIKDHIYRHKIRMANYFHEFDTEGSGRVMEAVFRRAIRWMANYTRDGSQGIYISEPEVNALCVVYADPYGEERSLWPVFVDDIESDFDANELTSWCPIEIDFKNFPSPAPPKKAVLPPPSKLVSSLTYPEIMHRIGHKLDKSNYNIRSGFSEYDPKRYGHVKINALNPVLVAAGILSTDHELNVLSKHYIDDMGFNYSKFITDLSKLNLDEKESLHGQMAHQSQMEKKQREETDLKNMEKNIVEVLAKISQKLICYQINTIDFIKPHDKLRKDVVKKEDFIRSLDQCKLDLTPTEVETIVDVFKNEKNPNYIDYVLFCRVVDEGNAKPCLKRVPLKEAMANISLKAPPPVHTFVNFDERQKISVAMKKLAKSVGLGQINMFKALDGKNKGTIRRESFIKILGVLGLLSTVSLREIDAMVKGFGIPYGDVIELDYLSFLNALDIVYRTQKAANV